KRAAGGRSAAAEQPRRFRELRVPHIHDDLASRDQPFAVDLAILVLVTTEAEDLRAASGAHHDRHHVAETGCRRGTRELDDGVRDDVPQRTERTLAFRRAGIEALSIIDADRTQGLAPLGQQAAARA